MFDLTAIIPRADIRNYAMILKGCADGTIVELSGLKAERHGHIWGVATKDRHGHWSGGGSFNHAALAKAILSSGEAPRIR